MIKNLNRFIGLNLFSLQSIYQPSGPSVEAKLRIDERHEELKRQIAMKEKLLAEMQSERESTRRLRV